MLQFVPFQLSAISDSNDLIASSAASSSSSSPAAAAASPPGAADRPHTISSAYEKGALHQRPQLTPYTFEQGCISLSHFCFGSFSDLTGAPI